jgi:hypothetical protein
MILADYSWFMHLKSIIVGFFQNNTLPLMHKFMALSFKDLPCVFVKSEGTDKAYRKYKM